MRTITTDEQVRQALVDLFGACLDYTHSNQGQELHRTSYMQIDDLTHALVFYVGGPAEVGAILNPEASDD